MALDPTTTQVVKYAAALATVGGAIKLAYAPLKNAVTKRREKKAEFERKLLDGLASLKTDMDGLKSDIARVESSVSSLTEDVSELQGDRLGQAHRYWTRLGWCPASEKSKLVSWHAKYRAKGYNHLLDSYEQDILALPETPAERSNP